MIGAATMRVAFAALFAAAVGSSLPQSGHGGTTADVSACVGTLRSACASEIDGANLDCRAAGALATLGADCDSATTQPRIADQKILASLCSTPLCLASEQQSAAKGTGDLLLGAALPLLLGALALVGAMGIRPRA